MPTPHISISSSPHCMDLDRTMNYVDLYYVNETSMTDKLISLILNIIYGFMSSISIIRINFIVNIFIISRQFDVHSISKN